VNPIHLFTLRGIPVFVSPTYLILLFLYGYRSPLAGLIWGACITLSLLVHEFGHALVAQRLRHDPAIMLHGFGGLTTRTRTGRDVEEAALVAMGPAAGLALGLVVYALVALVPPTSPITAMVMYSLLRACIFWNLVNLLPVWPLDGGQLLKLGTGRLLSPVWASRVTHGMSLLVLVPLLVYAYQEHSIFLLVILVMIAMQNVQALQGYSGDAGSAARTSSLARELLDQANAALTRGEYKEAARLAHQARAQDGVSPALMERIWQILGVATERLGEYEEALAYLRRARPNSQVREATAACLEQLGRSEELVEIKQRWGSVASAPRMHRWLAGALTFIALSVVFVFQSPLSALVWR